MKKTNKHSAHESKSRIVRVLYISIGFILFALGCVGIIIPILPTVPFFLATSFCFVRGSSRFHDKFLNSKLYKRYIEWFAIHKTMSIASELALMILVSAMLIVSMVLVNNLAMTIVICVLLAAKYSYFALLVKPVSRAELRKLKASNHTTIIADAVDVPSQSECDMPPHSVAANESDTNIDNHSNISEGGS